MGAGLQYWAAVFSLLCAALQCSGAPPPQRQRTGAGEAPLSTITVPPPPDKETVQAGLDAVHQLYKKQGSVIKLTEAEYISYVVGLWGKAQFDAFIFFSGNQYYCPSCRNSLQGYTKVAELYKQKGLMHADVSRIQMNDRPVFFFELDLTFYKNIAGLHKIRAVPVLVHNNPLRLQRALTGSDTEMAIPDEDYLTCNHDGSMKFDQILSWTNIKSGRDIDVQITALSRVGVSGVLVGVLCFMALVGWKMSVLIRQHPAIMGFLALLLQWLSSSGLFWSMQNGFRTYGFSQRGLDLMVIGRKGQYLFEGLFGGFLSIAIGSCWLGIVYTLTKSKGMKRNVTFLKLFALSLVFYFILLQMQFMKLQLTSMPITPPPLFRRGPLQIDRGNSW